ncbi:MAG TPA: hypothetical protein VL651_13710, partial [Bacteroidia bacterium]|nr:hypothetical protein [Bacteroidia bacterium]
MSVRTSIFLFIIPLFLFGGFVNNSAFPAAKENVDGIGGHDKTKHKKKKKKKKKHSKHKAPQKVDTAKARKLKAKRDKKHDKNLAKVQKDRAKTATKVAKQRDKGRVDYSDCDSADVVRTSKDTLILAKYMKVYHSLGGICYIIHLQDMADLIKTSDGFYTVEIKKSADPRAPADWQTYLYCPIGKPDGFIALV